MIEYPPQTSLALKALGWKCLLVCKLIESCSQIKHKMTCILSHNTVGWSDVLQVCVHLQVVSRKLPFIQVENVVVTNPQTLFYYLFILFFCHTIIEIKNYIGI